MMKSSFHMSRMAAVACMAVVAASHACLAQGDAAAKHAGSLVVRPDEQLGLVVPSLAQRRTLFAAADALLAILRRNDALQHPLGYALVLHRAAGVTTTGGDTIAPGLPPHYGVVGDLSYYAVSDDGQITDGGGLVPIEFMVNTVGRIEDAEVVTPALDHGPPVLQDYRVTSQFRGHPVYNGECVLISRRPNVPPFVPLTQERYISLQILKAQADSARHDAQHREDSGNTSSSALAAWIKDRPRRETDMRATYDAVKKFDAKSADDMLKAWKQSEVDAEANLRSAAGSGADQRIKEIERQGTVGEGQRIAALRAQLDALTPAERKAPAAILQLGVDGEKLTPVGDPEALPLVQLNPAYFDKTLPVDTPQLVTVCIPGFQADVAVTKTEWNDQRARDAALIRDHLDWAALEALVKKP
jgi:hypothetical protein